MYFHQKNLYFLQKKISNKNIKKILLQQPIELLRYNYNENGVAEFNSQIFKYYEFPTKTPVRLQKGYLKDSNLSRILAKPVNYEQNEIKTLQKSIIFYERHQKTRIKADIIASHSILRRIFSFPFEKQSKRKSVLNLIVQMYKNQLFIIEEVDHKKELNFYETKYKYLLACFQQLLTKNSSHLKPLIKSQMCQQESLFLGSVDNLKVLQTAPTNYIEKSKKKAIITWNQTNHKVFIKVLAQTFHLATGILQWH